MNQMSQQQSQCADDRNRRAVLALQKIGFEQVRINKSLPKLTGLSHQEAAGRLGVSRQAVTNTLNCDRRNRELQRHIATVYCVPVDVLFPGGKAAGE